MNQDDITKLEVYLRRWTSTHPGWQRWSADEMAAELARDGDFNLMKLADWLQTPDGELIEQIVGRLLPYPYNYGADVLAEAIQIAARQRTRRQRLEAFAVGGGLAVLLILALRQG